MDYHSQEFDIAIEKLSKLNTPNIAETLFPAVEEFIIQLEDLAKMQTISSSIENLTFSYHASSPTKGIVESAAEVAQLLGDIGLNTSVISESASSIALTLEKLSSSSDCPDDDYVTIAEDPIKEFNVPDTVAIRLGNNRIRMRTDIFISLIGILISIIIALSGSGNQQVQEQNQILYDILESIDSSNSSQKEYFEDIHSALEYQNQTLEQPESHPDTVPQSTDNTNKSDCTASEN